MAASPPTASAVRTAPKTDGGNVLAALLAAAAASMHCKQQQQSHLQQQQLLQLQQQQRQRQIQANVSNKVKEVHQNHLHNLHHNQQQQLLQLQSQSQSQQSNRSNGNINANISNSNNRSRNKTNDHKSSTSSSSSTSTSTDKDSKNAAKLLVSLANGTYKEPTAETSHVEMRNLVTWHDEDEQPMDESCLQELELDPSNSNGWSADEMFKYNEKMHKITSSYNEKTLSKNYTTPLPKMNSKTTMRLATQLAKEIQERVIAEGRITPESSDDDELFEAQRMKRVQLKQQKQLDQLKNIQRQSQSRLLSNHRSGLVMNNVAANKTNTTKSSTSQYSTETPATASLSSSPTLNDLIIKPVTSSSRNILRTCLS